MYLIVLFNCFVLSFFLIVLFYILFHKILRACSKTLTCMVTFSYSRKWNFFLPLKKSDNNRGRTFSSAYQISVMCFRRFEFIRNPSRFRNRQNTVYFEPHLFGKKTSDIVNYSPITSKTRRKIDKCVPTTFTECL
jgi:hypothetical protein